MRVALPGQGGSGAEVGLPVGGAGGGEGASFAGEGAFSAPLADEEVAGAEGSGTVFEGEAVAFFFFFLGTGGTKGSARPASLLPAPVLLAPVSSASGGEKKSSSVRW